MSRLLRYTLKKFWMCMPVVAMGERNGLLSKIYDDPKYNAAFDRCIDVMTKLMLKYGKQVLEQHQTTAPVSLQKQPDTKQISSFADAA